MKIFETSRFFLRPFEIGDAIHFFELNNDPEVIRYTGDDHFADVEEATRFLENYKPYEKYGFGRWAVIRKEDGAFTGWCGLKFHPEDNLVDVGYRFFKKYWGLGYATETALASIQYGFNVLKLARIYAHAMLDNKASHNVLEKCGMHKIKEITYHNTPALLYVVQNPELQIKEIPSLQTYPVRHVVLRKGRPVETCKFDGDDLSTTFHLGAFFKEELVGVVTVLLQDHAAFDTENQFQLRGMAVLDDFRRRGIGELLVEEAEKRVLNKNGSFIWMNARLVAERFYSKIGYESVGAVFEIKEVGPHYVMKKQLL